MASFQVRIGGEGFDTLVKAWIRESCPRNVFGEEHKGTEDVEGLPTCSVGSEVGKQSFEQGKENAVTEVEEISF